MLSLPGPWGAPVEAGAGEVTVVRLRVRCPQAFITRPCVGKSAGSFKGARLPVQRIGDQGRGGEGAEQCRPGPGGSVVFPATILEPARIPAGIVGVLRWRPALGNL